MSVFAWQQRQPYTCIITCVRCDGRQCSRAVVVAAGSVLSKWGFRHCRHRLVPVVMSSLSVVVPVSYPSKCTQYYGLSDRPSLILVPLQNNILQNNCSYAGNASVYCIYVLVMALHILLLIFL